MLITNRMIEINALNLPQPTLHTPSQSISFVRFAPILLLLAASTFAVPQKQHDDRPSSLIGTVQKVENGSFALLSLAHDPHWNFGQVSEVSSRPALEKALLVTAPPFNAKCDGRSDDREAIQAAFDEAKARGSVVEFPAATCLTSTIKWLGQSFFGAGTGITMIKGMPGEDVFQTPDTAAPHSLTNYGYVHDLTIAVDTSVDASDRRAGGNDTLPNRIAGTKQGLTPYDFPISPASPIFGYNSLCPGAAISAGSKIVTLDCHYGADLTKLPESRVVGAPVTIQGAGPDGSDLKSTIVSVISGSRFAIADPAADSVRDAKGSFLNPISPPWYIGNAGFALPCSNSSTCPRGTIYWKFRNIQIIAQGAKNQQSHSAGFFSQLSMYGARFENIYISGFWGGYVEALPTIGSTNGFTSDTATYKDIDVFVCAIPMLTVRGNDRTLSGINLYASGAPESLGPFFLSDAPMKTEGILNWTINKLYSETTSTVSGEFARFMFGPFDIHGLNIASGGYSGDYIEWDASNSIVDGPVNVGLVIRGSGNRFANSYLSSSSIRDYGIDNSVITYEINGIRSYMHRSYYANRGVVVRDPLNKLDGSFLLHGDPSRPYLNASDLVTTCQDWSFANNPVGSHGSCIVDPEGSEITKGYYQSSEGSSAFGLNSDGIAILDSWAGSPRILGINLPLTKVDILVMGECVGSSSCSAKWTFSDLTAAKQLGSGTLTFDSTWSTQRFNADLSSAKSGDIAGWSSGPWTGNAEKIRIAYLAIRPAAANMTTDDRSDCHDLGCVNSSPISALTGNIGGRSLTAGQCETATTSVPGSTNDMVAYASPTIYPGDGFEWHAYIPQSGTVVVKLCAEHPGTPRRSSYRVKVTP